MKKNLGFTLIELLVVIAIIGILSTIVLSSLSSARAKGYDAKTKMQLSGFRAAAENYFTGQNPNGYASEGATISDCGSGMFNDVDPKDGSPELYIDSGNLPNNTQVYCGATQFEYAVKATLYSGDQYWCVDSKGASRAISGTPNSGTFCP